MKRRVFAQHKLWRDKMVELCENNGSVINCAVLDDAGYDRELRIKLMEEAEEVCSAQSEKALAEELADVLEVIRALTELHGVSFEHVSAVQLKKREDRGGFAARKYVVSAEHLPGSESEQYCLRDPKKYPEIV